MPSSSRAVEHRGADLQPRGVARRVPARLTWQLSASRAPALLGGPRERMLAFLARSLRRPLFDDEPPAARRVSAAWRPRRPRPTAAG